jgi:hypothetical protein
MTSEDNALSYLKMPKDVYVEIPFTFTNDSQCVKNYLYIKAELQGTFVVNMKKCIVFILSDIITTKKKLAYKTRQSKSLLCGRCRRLVARK